MGKGTQPAGNPREGQVSSEGAENLVVQGPHRVSAPACRALGGPEKPKVEHLRFRHERVSGLLCYLW